MKNSISEKIGKRIRATREELGYTQQGVADILKITGGAYAKIERGETDIQATRLFALADLFNVDVVNLLKDSDELLNDGRAPTGELRQLRKEIDAMQKKLEKIMGPAKMLKK